MSHQKTSLSPAQIQFLKISPKIGNSEDAKRHMMQVISEQQKRATEEFSTSANSINKVPKFTFGQFEKTVNNFGVLLNKNFGTQTTIHQMQKFGTLAKAMNIVMEAENDKPIYNEKKNTLLKKIKDRSDNRTFLKSIYDLGGQKIYVVLKSFNIETASAHKTMDGLPIPYIKFLVSHVNSSRLAKIIEGAITNENNVIMVDYEKMESRAAHLSNSQNKYQNISYKFERMGQQLNLTLPYIQFSHVESNFQQIVSIQNREILQIIQSNFDNVGQIIQKYLDKESLDNLINKISKKNQNSQQHPNQQYQLEQKGVQQQQSVHGRSGEGFNEEEKNQQPIIAQQEQAEHAQENIKDEADYQEQGNLFGQNQEEVEAQDGQQNFPEQNQEQNDKGQV